MTDEMINIRVTTEEKETIKNKSAKLGLNISQYARMAMLDTNNMADDVAYIRMVLEKNFEVQDENI